MVFPQIPTYMSLIVMKFWVLEIRRVAFSRFDLRTWSGLGKKDGM